MLLFEWIIGILLAAVLLATIARRIGAPYPAMLALGGVVLAFIPGAPRIVLEPELALALFVAPVLFDAAYDTSLRDLRDNWLPVTCLVLVAVGFTTAAVAVVAHALTGMSWAAAIALGAIVAPPDAAAATSVLRQVRLPHRIAIILEGESLLNDASALLIYRVAVLAVSTGSFSVAELAPTFFLSVVGSIIAGLTLAPLSLGVMHVMRRTGDAPTSILLQFITAFGVWIFAERVGLSPVLTVVVFAVTVARKAPAFTPAGLRVPSYAVWDTAVFVLNVLAFMLIGLQIGPILGNLQPSQRIAYLAVAGAVLATVILVRIAWVMLYNTVVRWHIRRHGFNPPRPMMAPSVQSGMIISWCGMRGIVTLATALALPDSFPQRDLALVTAFSVVLGTLVLQGLTLRPLLLWLDLHDDDPVGREVARARAKAYRAALIALDGDDSPMAAAMRGEFEAVLTGNEDGEYSAGRMPANELRLRAVEAARRVLLIMRASGEIGDDAFHRLEEEIDRLELSAS